MTATSSGKSASKCRSASVSPAASNTTTIASTPPRLSRTARRNTAYDFEGLGVRLALDLHNCVLWHGKVPRLQPFLQQRLGVLGDRVGIRSRYIGGIDALDRRVRIAESTVEKDRPKDRFERVGKNRRARRSTAFQLALAQPDRRSEVERRSVPIQGVAVDEARAHPRQIALRHLRETLVE